MDYRDLISALDNLLTPHDQLTYQPQVITCALLSSFLPASYLNAN